MIIENKRKNKKVLEEINKRKKMKEDETLEKINKEKEKEKEIKIKQDEEKKKAFEHFEYFNKFSKKYQNNLEIFTNPHLFYEEIERKEQEFNNVVHKKGCL